MTEKEILLEIMKKGCILSQSILAEQTGYSIQNINAWHNGRRTPKLSTLVKIAEAVGVEIQIKIEKKENV